MELRTTPLFPGMGHIEMGLFHCPMGALFRDDDPCIDCGLCEAVTKEEKVSATKKIRNYLRSLHKRTAEVRKIAVCGKGGVGKSTFISLLANVLSEKGYNVLALDTDESNPGLHRMLGLDYQPATLKELLAGPDAGQSDSNPPWIAKDEISPGEIPEAYFVEKGNMKFLSVGKIIDPFEGCACSMAYIARLFLDKLVLEQNDILIIDMESGIESFGRGVERTVDTVLIIVEPSFESIALAEKIGYMADGIGVSNVYTVLNKVPSKEIETAIHDKLNDIKIASLGTIFFSLEVNQAAFEGRAPGESEATRDTIEIAEKLLSAN